jgi:hypothetical protein
MNATPLYLIWPAFVSLLINGTLLLILSLIVIFNFKSLIKTDIIQLLPIVAILSVSFGMHGILHIQLEQAYNFNPLYMFFN